MKKFVLFAAICSLSMTSCLDDKGGLDQNSELPEVKMFIPSEVYSASLGTEINITPEVTTDIPESDLEFIWEVLGEGKNDQGNKVYQPLVPMEEQGKVLKYTGHLDENIAALNTAYTCRLHARQTSTGRDFYSSNTFTITLAGVTGLMVLHGDDSTSDVGVLDINEYMPPSIAFPEKAIAYPHIYSEGSGGERIQGKGKYIHQSYTYYHSVYAAYYPQYAPQMNIISAITDKDAAWLDPDALNKKGDWNYYFYMKGEEAINQNKPKRVYTYQVYHFALDGDDVFTCTSIGAFPFLFKEMEGGVANKDGNSVVLNGDLLEIGSGYFPMLFYTEKVNGVEQKGFWGVRSPSPGYWKNYGMLIDTKSDPVLFNPGNMKADLYKMALGASNHVYAALKGDADHPQFAGKFFGVQMQIGTGAYSTYVKNLYDFSSLTDINNAKSFEFGPTANMAYYRTNNAVYRYHIENGEVSGCEKLAMLDGSSLDITGEITMMKLMPDAGATGNQPTHFPSNRTMAIATVDGGKSALWVITLDLMTGRANTAVKYDASNVEGWDFEKIYDIFIKEM